MVDIPGNASTTSTIGVGGSVNNQLEVVGDHDWFKINLTAGQSISVSLDGLTLVDPYLRIYDASGKLLYENDDISSGTNRDSLLAFTATYSGVYYIDVGAWTPEPPESPDYPGATGTYQLSVSTYTPPPLGTAQQLAEQLTEGYWDGEEQRFNVTQGGTITVNLTGLTPEGQNLALDALQTWSQIIGVTFSQVTTGGQIVFDDNEEGAFSDSIVSGGFITSSHVNVSADWLATYGTGQNTYSFQTYIHEIGHALGLGHQGNYNGEARYPYDAVFQNDSWAMSVMSYFSQSENTYFAGQGFEESFLTTPMMVDILAMSMLYGLSTTTKTGDNIYSFGAGAGASCIYDAGGTDWIYGGQLGTQRINLNPGTFSNIHGEVGNVSIAFGVTIENAQGGEGNDTIIGNSATNELHGGAGNDLITGGAGNDRLLGDLGNDSLDGGNGTDTVDFYHGSTAAVTANLALGTANSADGSHDTLKSIENLSGTQFDDSLTGNAANNALFGQAGNDQLHGGGGNDQLYGAHGNDVLTGGAGNDIFQDTASDLNGDTITDFAAGDKIVISDASLAGFTFSMSGNKLTYTGGSLILTGFTGQLLASAAAGGGVQLSTAPDVRNDFNGDGRSDILWRNDNGTVTNWLGRADGRFDGNTDDANIKVDSVWQAAGVGDFNGDGRDDMIWRRDNGALAEWLGQADGGFVGNASANYSVATSWHILGVGDFNGDARDDILWRNDNATVTDWLGRADGRFDGNTDDANIKVGADWNVAGVGDFNGDGYDDVIWRNDNGQMIEWLGQTNGGFLGNASASSNVATSWHVVGVGDFNGDGRGDILWRNDDGTVTNWLGRTDGRFDGNTDDANIQVGAIWDVAGIGDYNGDGRDDILWRNDSGTLAQWLGQPDGGFLGNAGVNNNVPTSWYVQSPDLWV